MGEERLDILADRVDTMACTKCGEVMDVRGFEPFTTVGCPECATKQSVPAQFGHFLLVGVLGKGGMGAVYKGLDQSLNRHVAIKVMRQEYGEDSQFLKSFLQEAQAAAALNHRNVAQIYSFGQEQGQPYIVMELVEGGRLDEWIENGKPIDESLLMDIGIHMVEGLSAAHEAGLVHGDIKPANILFNAKGVAKLADFGLASFVKKQQDTPGEIWGTPYYIPPEKVRLKPSDHRADIYSLGGTLYHALVGRPPFDGPTAKDVVKARLDHPPPDPRSVREDVTEATAHVLQRMMAEKPGRRYPTYPSLLADMKKAHRAALKHEEELRRQAEEAELEAPSSKGKWIGIASVLVLLAGGVGFRWWTTQRDTGPERVIVRHILDPATGKMAPVYADEMEDLAAVAERERTEREARTLEILKESIGLFAAGQTAAAQEKLTGRAEWLEASDPTRYHLRIGQALGAWAAGVPAEADPFVKEITAYPAPEEGAAPGGPEPAVRSLARLLGKGMAPTAMDKEAEGWTPGEREVADLAVGLRFFQQEKFEEAKKRFAAKADPADGWAASFRTLSASLLKQLEAWDTLQPKLTDKNPQQSIELLTSFREANASPFNASIGRSISRYSDLLSAQKAEAGKAAKKEQQEKEARDLDQIDQARKAAIGPIKERDFEAALNAVQSIEAKLETDAGRTSFGIEVKRMQRLVDLQAYLVESINKAPLAKPIPELGGRLTRADREGLHAAAVDGGGVVSWAKASAGLYLNLFNYYVTRTELPKSEQADKYVSMALYCERNRAMSPAKRYVATAMELDPEAAKIVAEVLPDLVPDLVPEPPERKPKESAQ